MITKFNTLGKPATSGGSSSNTLLYVAMGAVILYLAYRFVIKPDMERNKEKEKE